MVVIFLLEKYKEQHTIALNLKLHESHFLIQRNGTH